MSRPTIRDLPVPFHTALFHLRREYRLSQEEVAQRAGISASGYRKLERGLTRNPNDATWSGLAKAFGMSVADIQMRLVGRVGPHGGARPRPSVPSQDNEPQKLSAIAERIAVIVEGLPPLDADYVLAVCLQLHAIRYGGNEIYSVFGPHSLPKESRRKRR